MRRCQDWLKSFVEFGSYGEAPLKMIFWTGVSAIAGALRRRVWIDQRFFTWVPNFYIILVAPPGVVSKSTTANIGMNLLRQIPDIRFGPDVVTWQSLVTSFAESAESFQLPSGDWETMSSLTISSDELGTFLNPNDREMIDVLVSLWDGKKGTFRKQTKMSGNDTIQNPWINIIGCTTPSWIAENVPEYMIGGGFVSRCVFIYTDKKRQFVPYVDEAVPAEFGDLRSSLVHDLEEMSTLCGEFQISEPAREWGRTWYTDHWQKGREGLDTEQFANYLSRKQTHLHKLAMILSASQGNTLLIEPHHLQHAEAMLSSIEPDMHKVFARIGKSEVTKATAEILDRLDGYPIPKETLFRRMMHSVTIREFDEALAGVCASGMARIVYRENEVLVVRNVVNG